MHVEISPELFYDYHSTSCSGYSDIYLGALDIHSFELLC
jgi:hypothetical protein